MRQAASPTRSGALEGGGKREAVRRPLVADNPVTNLQRYKIQAASTRPPPPRARLLAMLSLVLPGGARGAGTFFPSPLSYMFSWLGCGDGDYGKGQGIRGPGLGCLRALKGFSAASKSCRGQWLPRSSMDHLYQPGYGSFPIHAAQVMISGGKLVISFFGSVVKTLE